MKEQQGWRSLFVRQRTALRDHLAEFGLVAPQGTANARKLEDALLASPGLPDLVHQIAADFLEQRLNEKICEIDSRALAKENEDSKRLISGVGPLTASAAFAPPLENFRSGRDLRPG